MEHLDPNLLAAAEDLGIQLPALENSARFSKEAVETARHRLTTACEPSDPIDVLALGSFARQESSEESDFDYLIIALGLPTDITKTKKLVQATEELREQLKLSEPGATGMFGRVLAAADLSERIGLEQDTNLTHSLRILILQESVSIYQPQLRTQLVKAIVDRYLVDYREPKPGVPRFLLNDVVRYWRTIAVDYQAKRWASWEEWRRKPNQVKWGLRYLKLRVTRKLMFAGTLASLLLPTISGQPASASYLVDQFSIPPLARLGQLYRFLKAEKKALKVCLQIADEFCGALAQDDFRREIGQLTEPYDAPMGSRFSQWRQRSDELQSALEDVFFGETLGQASRRYLSF